MQIRMSWCALIIMGIILEAMVLLGVVLR